MDLMETLSFAAPELALAIGAMALLMYGVFRGETSSSLVMSASIGLLVAGVGLVLMVTPDAGDRIYLFNDGFVVDAFSSFCKIVILLSAAAALVLSQKYLAVEKLARFEFPILVVLAALGMLLMVSSNDLISLYVGIELQSLALYVLAAYERNSQRATEAGLKYFVLGALSSGLLLYGASLIYGFTGATTFDAIAAAQADAGVGLVFGLVFLICGLAFKVSAAPFHMWTPDVYEGAPTPITALFAAAPKFAAMAIFVRVVVEAFPGLQDEWRQVIVVISLLSMFIGAFSALVQTNIKRLMAYSSISHMGYALLGFVSGDQGGVRSVLIYMTIYMIMTIGTFACILAMRRDSGMTEKIDDLAGLSRNQPMVAVALTVLLFSLAGVPPMAGFFAKLQVFFTAVRADLVWLAVAGVIASVIGAVYYLRIVKIMWFDEPAEPFVKPMGPSLSGALAASTLLIFPVLVIAPAPLFSAARQASAALFGG